MTKEKLLDLIKQYGSFWYISKHLCLCTHGSHIYYFCEAPASDVDRFDDLINKCVLIESYIRIDPDNKRLMLTGPCWWSGVKLYPTGVEGLWANYSSEDIALICATEQ